MIECSICKANNEDRSLFCLECGQRLKPKVADPHQSSSKLHSPMLDQGVQSSGRRNKSNNSQFNFSESDSYESENGKSMGISRNGLHSPLLDGRNYFANSYPSQSSKNNFAVEEQEYESLRSPLLETKVPLPEIPTGNSLNTNAYTESQRVPENGQTIQSILGATVTNNQPDAFIRASLESKSEEILSVNKRQSLNVSQSLLPADVENPKMQTGAPDRNKSTLIKPIIVPIIFLALGLKIWFLISLGNTLFASPSYAFDQMGQILAILSILIITLSI